MIVYWFMPHPLPPSFMRGGASRSELNQSLASGKRTIIYGG